jgi:hypothetical protein
MKKTFKILLTIKKIVKYGLFFGIPVLASKYPDIYNMSIGAGLVVVYDLLKHKVGVRLP